MINIKQGVDTNLKNLEVSGIWKWDQKIRIKWGKCFENNELQTDQLKFSNYQECQNSGQTLARWKKIGLGRSENFCGQGGWTP